MSRLIIIPEKHSESFIKDFNNNIPSKEFMESCEKAGRLFKQSSNNYKEDKDGR